MNENPAPSDSQPPVTQPVDIAAPALPFTMSASLALYRQRLGAWRVVVALAITGLIFYRFGPVAWIVAVIAILAIVFGVLWYQKQRTLTITKDTLEYKTAFGRVRTVKVSDIEGMKIFARYYEPTFGMFPRLIIGVRDGAPLSFMALHWNHDDLNLLIAAMREKKTTIEMYEDPGTYQMIAKQFPTYATYLERHPLKIGLIIGGIIVVLAIIAAFIMASN